MNKKNNTWKRIIALILIVFVSFQFQGCKKKIGDSDEKNTYVVERPDAEKYYEDNSKIISEINVEKSKEVQTEKEITTILNERGFDQYPIESTYMMSGEYYDSESISEGSAEKHPVYETYYLNKKEELWIITVINGTIMATPVSYNLQSEKEVQTVIAESEQIMSYDSTTNKFFETIPDKSVLRVVKVEKIDKETLEYLTIGEIEKYE